MGIGAINTWSVKLRDGPDGGELPGFVAIDDQVDVKVDDGSGWLLVVAAIDGEKRLGFLDGCYARLEIRAAFPVPVAPPGGIGIEVIRAAQAAHGKWGVPASATLAQWALESDFGRLTPPGSNNPFRLPAIEGKPKVEARARQDTGSAPSYVLAEFRTYASLAEAIDDHVQSIAETAKYASARLAVHNPLDFIDALAEVLSSDPQCGVALRELVRKYDLTQFD